MCMLIFQPKNKILNFSEFQDIYLMNQDGIGIAYIQSKSLIVKKGFFNLHEFYEDYVNSLLDYKGPVMIHFRMSTGGLRNHSNCHPFKISNDVCFGHNGVLDIQSSPQKSDTKQFAIELSSIHEKVFTAPFKRLLNVYFENNHSKAVFLREDGEYFICNEKAGEWIDGTWYSNRYLSLFYPKYQYNDNLIDSIEENDFYKNYNINRRKRVKAFKFGNY